MFIGATGFESISKGALSSITRFIRTDSVQGLPGQEFLRSQNHTEEKPKGDHHDHHESLQMMPVDWCDESEKMVDEAAQSCHLREDGPVEFQIAVDYGNDIGNHNDTGNPSTSSKAVPRRGLQHQIHSSSHYQKLILEDIDKDVLRELPEDIQQACILMDDFACSRKR
jgi:hypothetical protein